MDTPPVVDEHVENAQHNNQERRRPLRFKAYCHHRACSEADQGDKDTRNAPFPTESEANEEENEENTSCQKEAVGEILVRILL